MAVSGGGEGSSGYGKVRRGVSVKREGVAVAK